MDTVSRRQANLCLEHISAGPYHIIIGHSPGSGSGLCHNYRIFAGKHCDALTAKAPAAVPVLPYPPQKAIAGIALGGSGGLAAVGAGQDLPVMINSVLQEKPADF